MELWFVLVVLILVVKVLAIELLVPSLVVLLYAVLITASTTPCATLTSFVPLALLQSVHHLHLLLPVVLPLPLQVLHHHLLLVVSVLTVAQHLAVT